MSPALDTRPPPRAPGSVGLFGYRGSRPRPAGGFELWTWLFQRISGFVLLFLVVGHVLIMVLPSKGVGRIDFAFVAARWRSPFWRSWDWAMLSLALLHGVNGLRVIVRDYVRPAAWRFAVNTFFCILAFVLFVLGTVVVFTFNPGRWPGAS